MPRIRKRKIYLKILRCKIGMRKRRAFTRFILDEESAEEDVLDECYHFECRRVEERRYLYRKPYRPTDNKYWLRYFNNETYTNEDKFRELFNCKRPYFNALHLMITNNSVFTPLCNFSQTSIQHSFAIIVLSALSIFV